MKRLLIVAANVVAIGGWAQAAEHRSGFSLDFEIVDKEPSGARNLSVSIPLNVDKHSRVKVRQNSVVWDLDFNLDLAAPDAPKLTYSLHQWGHAGNQDSEQEFSATVPTALGKRVAVGKLETSGGARAEIFATVR